MAESSREDATNYSASTLRLMCRGLNVTPHTADKKRWSAADGWTILHDA